MAVIQTLLIGFIYVHFLFTQMSIITGKDRYINRDRIRIAAHIFNNLFKTHLTTSSLKIMFKFLPVFAILGISAVLVRMTF